MRIVWGRRSHRLGLVTALPALALYLALAAPAAAEVRSGSTTDPVDESLPGGLDIVGVGVGYDTTAGAITAQLTTRSAPTLNPEAGLAIGLGTFQGSECTGPFALLLGFDSNPPSAAWEFGGGIETAQIGVSGSTTTLSASGAALVGQSFNCAEGLAFVRESGKTKFVDATSPLQLVVPPPAPTPPPATPTPTPPPPPQPKPQAGLTIPSQTLTVHRNAWKKVKVTVTNAGNATAAKVTLKVGKAKGVAVKPRSGTLKLKSIAAGKSKTASFKVLLTRKAKANSTLKLAVAGAKGVKANGALTIKAWKKPSQPKKGKSPAPTAAPLAEKIFYRLEMQTSESAKLAAVTFVDGTWAYTGMSSGGLPNCTGVTGGPETEGCVRYTYDPRSGAVQLESTGSGKITSGGGLEIGEKTYSPTAIPAAGTTLQVEQKYAGFSGLCGPFSTCTTWQEYLTLTSSGEFILSRHALTTSEGAGTYVAAGSYPPDQHGTYAIESRARIKLNFADGTSRTKTIAILLNKDGKPDPANEGLLLDSAYFTFAHTG